MDDIVERLRSENRMAMAPLHMSDAADEIERLRDLLLSALLALKGARLSINSDLNAALDSERLRQAIWNACRVLGMNADHEIAPLTLTSENFADLILDEAVRSTSESQQEVERLQAVEDANAAQIEALHAEVDAVKRMHHRFHNGDADNGATICYGCGKRWPCPTITAMEKARRG